MKPAAFEYHAPALVEDALVLLAEHAEAGARVIAGGQSLVPAMALRLARPPHLVDINRIVGLDRLGVEGDVLVVGACVRHAAFHRPGVAAPLGALLADVARHIAHLPIRTRGTFCGSLANADPASEWCLVAATLGASVVLSSLRGTRTLAADDFLQGTMSTARDDDELLVEARLPLPAADTRHGFCEFSRRAGDFALAMALVTLRVRDGLIVEPRVGVGGVEDRARRIASVEHALAGQPVSAAVLDAAAQAAASAVDPVDDGKGSVEYRRELVQAMVRRALGQALPEAAA